jgi:anti-sigma factor RsiW
MNSNTNDPDRERLLRYLKGDLSPEARAEVDVRLRRDDGFRATYDRLRAVRDTVQDTSASFAAGFSERVMDRVRPQQGDALAALYEPIRGAFLRLALAALLLIGGLGTYNAMQYQETGAAGSPVEAALGLPEVTYGTALQAEWQLDPDDAE